MPTAVPNLPGIMALWDFAIRAGFKEEALAAELRRDGVQVLELSISGKKALFAAENDLTAFVMRRAMAETKPKTPAKDLNAWNERQADELAALKAEVAALKAAFDAEVATAGKGARK